MRDTSFTIQKVIDVGSDGIAKGATEVTFPYVIAPPTNNLLTGTGTVTAQVAPGGLYALTIAIDQAVLGATANTLASVTTTINSVTCTYAGTAPSVGQLVAGTGINAGTYIETVTAGVGFTLSQPATASGTVTLNVTAGSFNANFERSTDGGTTWTTASCVHNTFAVDAIVGTSGQAPGQWLYQATGEDTHLRINVTALSLTGVAGNLSSLQLRCDIDSLDRIGSAVNLPYVCYVAATAATFPTGIAAIMPVNTSLYSEIIYDVFAFAGTSQTITWRQSGDDKGIKFSGITSTTTQVAQNSAAITANAVGAYRIAPASKYFYAAMTGGTAVTSHSVSGCIARVGDLPSIMPVHISTNNVPINISQFNGSTVQTGGATGVMAVGGKDAHSAATTVNPLLIGGRVAPTTAATVDTTLVAGDAAWGAATTGNQLINKPFGTAELDYAAIRSLTPTVWASASTLVQVRAASGTASVRTYATSMQLSSDALSAATSLWLVDGAVAISSSTVATPGVITSGTHDFKVGDAIVLQGIATLALTGVSANQVVYVATVPSTTTFTVALTPGGTGVQCTASGTATAYRILRQVRFQTAALPATNIEFDSPIRTAPNVALSLLCSATTTGTIYADVNGYYGF